MYKLDNNPEEVIAARDAYIEAMCALGACIEGCKSNPDNAALEQHRVYLNDLYKQAKVNYYEALDNNNIKQYGKRS